MDHIDLKILNILQKKARIPNVEVARAIGMAPSAVLERIKKLEAAGIISGYEVRLNPIMFGKTLTAFIHILVKTPGDLHETGQALSCLDPVQEVHHLTGEDSLMIKVKVRDNARLEKFLRNRIATIPAICQTRTTIALATYKETAKITLPDQPPS